MRTESSSDKQNESPAKPARQRRRSSAWSPPIRPTQNFSAAFQPSAAASAERSHTHAQGTGSSNEDELTLWDLERHTELSRRLEPSSRRVPEIAEGTSPFIAAEIRRQRLEREQAKVLKAVVDELGYDPFEELSRQAREAREYTRSARLRSRIAGATEGIFSRRDIIERDASTCYLCGKICDLDEIHLDHEIPLSRGGAHVAENVRVACAPCNLSKGAMTSAEYRATLEQPF